MKLLLFCLTSTAHGWNTYKFKTTEFTHAHARLVNRNMIVLDRLLIIIFFISSTTAFAHSPLVYSSPKNGAILKITPSKIILGFESDVRLTKIELFKIAPSKTKTMLQNLFGNNKGTEIILETELPREAAKKHTIKLPEIIFGDYHVDWRALSGDGHVMKGNLQFTISAP